MSSPIQPIEVLLSAAGGAAALKGLLLIAGFTAKGIAAGYPAAIWHAAIGNATSGSLFSFLQALGAGPAIGWILLGAILGVSGYLLYKWWKNGGRDKIRELLHGNKRKVLV